MNNMKKFIVFLVCAVLLMGAARIITLRYQDRPEEFSGMQEWIELGKEKVEEVTDKFSEQISEQVSEQEWELDGSYDIDSDNWFDDEGRIYSGSMSYSRLSSGEVNHLILQAAGCEIVTVITEEQDFYFSFENMKKVQAYQSEDCLSVKVVRDTLVNDEELNNILTLYVPAGCVLESIELELGAGSIVSNGLQAEILDLTVEAGKLTIESLKAEEVNISLGAGAVVLDQAVIHDAEFSVGAGSMKVDGSISGDVKADCAMGNLQMNLQGDVKDFNYELQCVAGSILLNGEKHSGINEGMLIGNAAVKDMELNCAVGNIKIEFVQ